MATRKLGWQARLLLSCLAGFFLIGGLLVVVRVVESSELLAAMGLGSILLPAAILVGVILTAVTGRAPAFLPMAVKDGDRLVIRVRRTRGQSAREIRPWIRASAWLYGVVSLIVAALLITDLFQRQASITPVGIVSVALGGLFAVGVLWCALTGRAPPIFPLDLATDDELLVEVHRGGS